MKSLQLVQYLNARRLKDATDTYLGKLQSAPFQASEAHTKRVLAELAQSPGPHVYLGETPSRLKVRVPLAFLIRACCITTGGTGAGKTMAALLPLEAIVRRLPGLKTVGFGVLDAKGELFDRAVYLLAARLAELHGRERQELLERIVIVDFANRVSLSPYNILARWSYAEPDFFITSRLETLRELLPSGEKLSLRGASVLKHILTLLSESNLPLTYLDRVLGDEPFRKRLLGSCRNEELALYFRTHFNAEGKQTIAALRARMDSLFASEGVRLALSGDSAPDFLRLQNEGKIVLINCAGPTITRGVRLLLQGLVLSDIRQAIFTRPNNPPVTYWWCADEAQNFFLTRQMQENLTDILTMARDALYQHSLELDPQVNAARRRISSKRPARHRADAKAGTQSVPSGRHLHPGRGTQHRPRRHCHPARSGRLPLVKDAVRQSHPHTYPLHRSGRRGALPHHRRFHPAGHHHREPHHEKRVSGPYPAA